MEKENDNVNLVFQLLDQETIDRLKKEIETATWIRSEFELVGGPTKMRTGVKYNPDDEKDTNEERL
jgi:ribosomal protein S25